jgi:hypothetical protein
MSDAPQPTSGSLEAKIIRACPTHRDCPLTCKQRRIEDLGEIASFDVHQESSPDSRSWIVDQFKRVFGKEPS